MNNEQQGLAGQDLSADEILMVSGGMRNGDLDCTGIGCICVYVTTSGAGGTKCDVGD